MTTYLKNLTAGESATITGFNQGNLFYRKKLLSFGLTPGTTFKVIRYAPMADPIEIYVRGFNVTLRKNEADLLKVVRL